MIKKGQVLKAKNPAGMDIEIIEVLTYVVCYRLLVGFRGPVHWSEISDIEENYIIPAEKWVPKLNQYYYAVNSDGRSERLFNEGTDYDRLCIEIGNCFETEEDMKPYAEKFKEIFKK